MNKRNQKTKSIVVFMGHNFDHERQDGLFKLNTDMSEIHHEVAYDQLWDNLMPVVEKIEEDERFDVEILQYGTRILDNHKEIVNNVADISFTKKIEHTYEAVVEFVKWYNRSKYPFNEGDDYYTIEDKAIIWSCWDEVSEEMHRDMPNRKYFTSVSFAQAYVERNGIEINEIRDHQ